MSEYRLVVVGGGGVGKSALTVRFVQGSFVERYDPTIEDSYRKQVEVDGKACMLDIMDTAGQEEFGSLRDQYIRTGEGFLLVYSLISAASLDSATQLRTSILRLKDDAHDFPVVLVGNKSDLKQEGAERAGAVLAERWNIPFIETSAKSKLNVDEAFTTVVKEVIRWRADHPNLIAKEKKKNCIVL